MPLVIGTHEVGDVKKWLDSPLRKKVFEARGIKFATFVDPKGSNKTALLFDVPDMESFQALMESNEVSESAAADGVNLETLEVFVQK